MVSVLVLLSVAGKRSAPITRRAARKFDDVFYVGIVR